MMYITLDKLPFFICIPYQLVLNCTDHILNSDSSELVQTLKCEEEKLWQRLKASLTQTILRTPNKTATQCSFDPICLFLLCCPWLGCNKSSKGVADLCSASLHPAHTHARTRTHTHTHRHSLCTLSQHISALKSP